MAISKLLLKWYNNEGRELPWRETHDPYKIWISEIILQQTRVQQGIEYYLRFIEKFPDIHTLANAEIVDVLNVWQGLGYYSRARNVHHSARLIQAEYDGNFPENYNEILKLKGIGEYTAGAIASIAFGEIVPAIDGNVKRVVSRLMGSFDDPDKTMGSKKIRDYLNREIDPVQPGNFNQAFMDLGALVCTPSSPMCPNCPLANHCEANLKGLMNEIPVRNKVRKTRHRYFYYLIISSGKDILLRQRNSNDIWKLLYEFPLIESDIKLSNTEIYLRIAKEILTISSGYTVSHESDEIIHILSHQKIHARFIHIEVQKFPNRKKLSYKIIKKESVSDFPLPRLIDRYLKNYTL